MKKKQKGKVDISNMQLERLKKILKWVVILSLIILFIEGIIFLSMKINQFYDSVYYDAFSMADVSSQDRIVVGSSDFKHSEFVSYTNGIEKGKIAKYDSNGNLLWEKAYDEGFSSTFSAVKTISDGYLVAGSAEFTDYQHENKIREGILLKYDFDGNKIWQKRYKVLSDTRFLNILLEDDGFVVVGQSIYENLELGNHTTGGGIIVKYDYDGNVIWNSNYGGNKSGIFRDIVKVDGGYVTVGRDSKDTGIVVFFDEKGERKWVRNYSYTDSDGFYGIAANGNDLYVVGSKKIWTNTGDSEIDNARAAKNTDAVIVKYNTSGEMFFEKTFGGSNYERYQDVYLKDNFLYLVGHLTSQDAGLEVMTKENTMTGLLVKANLDGTIVDKKTFGGSHDDNLLYLMMENDHFLAVGLSKSKDGDLKHSSQNGRDYYGQLITFDQDLNLLK